jgi:hypothetical protein
MINQGLKPKGNIPAGEHRRDHQAAVSGILYLISDTSAYAKE